MIPSHFNILGRKIKVVFDDRLESLQGATGNWHHSLGVIRLQTPDADDGPSEEYVEHVFFHELAHCLLDSAGTTEGFTPPLSEREDFVDRLGGLLHQFARTVVYNDKR